MDLIVLRESRISHLESLTDAVILLVLTGSRVLYSCVQTTESREYSKSLPMSSMSSTSVF